VGILWQHASPDGSVGIFSERTEVLEKMEALSDKERWWPIQCLSLCQAVPFLA
jgi:hypothetical protein